MTGLSTFLYMPGPPELIIVLAIAILLFGANKIPELARSTGQAVTEFEKGRQELEEELQEAKETDEPETEEESDAASE